MSRAVRSEPIAVTGMACRLPGAPDPDAFWDLVREGRDALTEAPPERYGGQGRAPRGGFLDDVAGFDAEFFGISPREASAMDPQQRLMLELAWEALEDARVPPDRLRGTDTGVFLGAMADDYAHLTHAQGAAAITAHTLPGLLRGVLAGRLSHVLGLGGPALTVDTGQSSGLAAVHTACASLWRGETETALVGAVHLNLAHGGVLAAQRSGALSPDGRCRTFDARADGYARGEGGVLMVLKPLERAITDGDRVHCVVLGSAMTADGGPDPLTVPGRRAQEEVLRRACASAGVSPSCVRYVELHGTGTPVGDPVEAAALGAVLGAGRTPADALRVGSAKTNVGHLEGAAGMVGLLKTALCLRHGQLVPSLHFTTPNPAIPLADLGLRVQTALTDWPHPDEPPLAGVSSFGMGGTNCHVVLGAPPPAAVTEAPLPQAEPGTAAQGHATAARRAVANPPAKDTVPSPVAEAPSDRPSGEALRHPPHGSGTAPGLAATADATVPWLLSARTASALRSQARALAGHLRRRPSTDPSAAARTLATGRTHHEHRAVLRVPAGRSPLEALDALAEGRPDPSVLRGRARTGAGLAVLFTGQGVPWPGAGRSLYETHPVFAGALDEVCEHLDPHLGRSLHDLLLRPPDDEELTRRTDYAQPALFALETALLRLLESWGLRPTMVVGHSVGELTAAHAAGVFSLGDAAALIAARGRLMHGAPGEGAMLAVQASEDAVRAALPAGAVDIAAVNAPESVVVSGTVEAVEQVAAHWEARGRRTRRLGVGHGFHSPLMDPVLSEFRRVASAVTYRPPRLPVLSNVTGTFATAEQLCSPDYWTRHIRATVRFADAVRALDAHGVGAYVELGPEPALTAQAARCLPPTGPDDPPPPLLTATLRPGRDETEALLTAVARLHVAGQEVDWSALLGPGPGADLPTYAFQRRRHWLAGAPAADVATGAEGVGVTTPAPNVTAHEVRGDHTGGTVGRDRTAVMATTSQPGDGLALAEAGATAGLEDLADRPRWLQMLTDRSGPERYRITLDLVRSEAAAVLDHPGPDAIDPRRSFRDAGFDSVTGVEYRDRLREFTGLPLPATLVFDRPTPVALAEFLLAELTTRGPGPDRALAALDRLRAVLSEAPVDPATGDRLTDGLRELLSSLAGDAASDLPPAASADITDLTEKIGTATDDEIFALLDRPFDA